MPEKGEEEVVWLQITSGDGPEECALVVGHLAKRLSKEAKALGFFCDVVDAEPGRETGCFASLLLQIRGAEGPAGVVQNFADAQVGSHQWICKSPFRPNHKRKNWFVGVEAFAPPPGGENLAKEDVRIETYRASGPGGQHVNTTDSAVRATHIPTGIRVVAQTERSQHMNKKLALAQLAARLAARETEGREQAEKERWAAHKQLVRGAPARTFSGPAFKEKKP